MRLPLPLCYSFLRAVLLAGVATCCLPAATINPLYWADATTDSSGTYSNSPGAFQVGNSVAGVIPTGASQPGLDSISYFRTLASLPGASTAYDGTLLGDLSGRTGLTATFRINDSALAAGSTFAASSIVGDSYPGQTGSNAGIRLMFMAGYLADRTTPNEWWSRGAVSYVTSMRNGQGVTLTVDFDPFLWSNYYGHVGTESADTLSQFNTALAGVTRLGLSFGSGYFFSNGFAFNTGGSANIQLDSIGTLGGSPVPNPSSTPEPATLALLGGAFVGLGLFRRQSLCR